MGVILQRLGTSLGLILPSGPADDNKIKTCIDQLPRPQRLALLQQHALINFEYTVLCSKLSQEFSHPPTRDVQEQLNEALHTAVVLKIIYRDYLDLPREVHRLENEIHRLKQYLQSTLQTALPHRERNYPSKTIRDKTGSFNFYRLLLVRSRRLLLAISQLTAANSLYREGSIILDQWVAPFLSHLAWFYFIPRILDNLIMIIKHTLEHAQMTREEKELGAWVRFKIQCETRWLELSNDIPWLLANLASCWVLTGKLAPYGIFLSIGMQLYEVAQTAIQVWYETSQYRKQRGLYESQLHSTDRTKPEFQQIESYIKHLNQRIHYEQWRLLISFTNVSVLMIAIILGSPFLSAYPIFAVIGGSLAVLITFISYLARTQFLDKRVKPKNQLFEKLSTEPMPRTSSNVSNTGLFKAPFHHTDSSTEKCDTPSVAAPSLI